MADAHRAGQIVRVSTGRYKSAKWATAVNDPFAAEDDPEEVDIEQEVADLLDSGKDDVDFVFEEEGTEETF
jgi:hypothetical protein